MAAATKLLALVTVSALGGLGWLAYERITAVDPSAPPLIRADDGPIKIRPEDPGGMAVPDQDKLIYQTLNGGLVEETVERLLPPPEEPLPPPEPPEPEIVEQAPAAVVLEAPYSSITDVARASFPFLPVKFLLLDHFDSAAKIAGVAAPLLIVHGARDGTIPLRFGEKLFAAAAEPKTLTIYPEAGHNDLYQYGMGSLTVDFIKASI